MRENVFKVMSIFLLDIEDDCRVMSRESPPMTTAGSTDHLPQPGSRSRSHLDETILLQSAFE
ncbi:hypothetical protein UPYG_G00354830 [Umbra pygmaea]|uniref:Uncharacterized protein n=1 Tax=Umbra pygmaea TaxID=75934 RepID=A0ABD0VVD2_UMBPY